MWGRDIGVVSMVLTLGCGYVWVCGVSLFDFFSFLLGVIVSWGGFFCLQSSVMPACAWLWRIWFSVGERTSV